MLSVTETFTDSEAQSAWVLFTTPGLHPVERELKAITRGLPVRSWDFALAEKARRTNKVAKADKRVNFIGSP